MDEAKKAHPKAHWWLKADGCDLVKGLSDSVDHERTGDVDLNDGKIAEQHKNFLSRLSLVVGICRDVTKSTERKCTLDDFRVEQSALREDITYLQQCMSCI